MKYSETKQKNLTRPKKNSSDTRPKKTSPDQIKYSHQTKLGRLAAALPWDGDYLQCYHHHAIRSPPTVINIYIRRMIIDRYRSLPHRYWAQPPHLTDHNDQVLPPPPSPPCTCGKILGPLNKTFLSMMIDILWQWWRNPLNWEQCQRWNGTGTSAGASRLGHAQCGEPLHRGEQGRLRPSTARLQRHPREQEVTGLCLDGQLQHLHDRCNGRRSRPPPWIGLPGPVLQKWVDSPASLWVSRNWQWQVSLYHKTERSLKAKIHEIMFWYDSWDVTWWYLILRAGTSCAQLSSLLH